MIQTITLNKTLSFDDTKVDIPALAVQLGYQDKIIDSTKLDANGNVPLEPAVDIDGNPVYEMIDEVQPDGTVKQVQGKQLTQPVDVYLPNPETHLAYLERTASERMDTFVSNLITDAMFVIQRRQLAQQEQAIKDNIKAGITTS